MVPSAGKTTSDRTQRAHGLAKPREAKHDSGLYRLYHKEATQIARAGRKPVRVILDYELKRDLYRDLAKLGAEKDDLKKKQEVAKKHGLELVNGKIPVPDLSIECRDSDFLASPGVPPVLDLENSPG